MVIIPKTYVAPSGHYMTIMLMLNIS